MVEALTEDKNVKVNLKPTDISSFNRLVTDIQNLINVGYNVKSYLTDKDGKVNTNDVIAWVKKREEELRKDEKDFGEYHVFIKKAVEKQKK